MSAFPENMYHGSIENDSVNYFHSLYHMQLQHDVRRTIACISLDETTL